MFKHDTMFICIKRFFFIIIHLQGQRFGNDISIFYQVSRKNEEGNTGGMSFLSWELQLQSLPPREASYEGLGFCFLFYVIYATLNGVVSECFKFWCFQDRQKDIDGKVKLQRFLYLMSKINPLLKHIQERQRAELEVEARTLGVHFNSCLTYIMKN